MSGWERKREMDDVESSTSARGLCDSEREIEEEINDGMREKRPKERKTVERKKKNLKKRKKKKNNLKKIKLDLKN